MGHPGSLFIHTGTKDELLDFLNREIGLDKKLEDDLVKLKRELKT